MKHLISEIEARHEGQKQTIKDWGISAAYAAGASMDVPRAINVYEKTGYPSKGRKARKAAKRKRAIVKASRRKNR